MHIIKLAINSLASYLTAFPCLHKKKEKKRKERGELSIKDSATFYSFSESDRNQLRNMWYSP